MGQNRRIKLQILFSLLMFFVIVITVITSWAISMSTYKKNTTDIHLTNNLNYVEKLSNITEHHLDHMLQNIVSIANLAGSHTISQTDLESWLGPNQESFNSTFITDEEGIIQIISPEKVVFEDGAVVTKGYKIDEDIAERLRVEKEPFISQPYLSKSGQLITLIAAPIINAETGEFTGAISGTIHMEKDNALNDILAEHRFDESTYVYVVDQSGRLIYHPSSERLWEDVSVNEVVQKVINGESGSDVVVNTEGREFIASYSQVGNVGWGIVSQTAVENINKPIFALFWRIVGLSIPFLIIVLLIGGLLVSAVTKPIKTLATYSEKIMNDSNLDDSFKLPRIQSRIEEVHQLYKQVSNHLSILIKQVSRDGLTNLANRRTFDEFLNKWWEKKVPFTLIMFDIDHFKRVNDTYGHLVGDEVLKFLAKEMLKTFNDLGFSFRYGGEEFAILIKNKTEQEVYEIAEQFRKKIANTPSPTGEAIEVSLGIASIRSEDKNAESVVDRADVALYHSKQTGRNKTTIFNEAIRGVEQITS